ncbi:hypothetical protein [Brevibacillus massiliensis]|uniref:hypothetical protein n=1 Tax=Brevibacillus massiliensis TaxID=1118054 RepID=UPI0002D2FAC5|nr:hypothetical protein [Brevibacillus massiliensis]
MAKIYELLEWKRQKTGKLVSFAEHLEKAKERRRRKPLPTKPADVLTIGQFRRLMGDTGPRQFLKDRGTRPR